MILLGIKCSSSEQTNLNALFHTKSRFPIAPQTDAADALCPSHALAVTQEGGMEGVWLTMRVAVTF